MFTNPLSLSQQSFNQEGESIAKKGKSEEVQANCQTFGTMHNDVIGKILSFLSFRNLLRLEQVDKSCRNTFTEARWEQLSVAHRLDFDWSICQEEEHPQRARFLLGKALHTYMDQRLKLKVRKTTVDATYLIFEGCMRRFPLFGAFVWSDLCEFGPVTIVNPKLSHLPRIFEQKLLILQNDTTTTCGGDLLMRAILQVRLNDRSKNYRNFKRAIEARASIASVFAIHLLRTEEPIQKQLHLITLSNFSVWMSHDFRALSLLKETDFSPVLSQCGIDEVPRVDLRGQNICQELMIAYHGHVPAHLWMAEADLKHEKGLYEEADALYEKALGAYEEQVSAYGERIPAKVWTKVAHLKLNKWYKNGHQRDLEDAERLFDRAVFADKEQEPDFLREDPNVNYTDFHFYHNYEHNQVGNLDYENMRIDNALVAKAKYHCGKYEEAYQHFELDRDEWFRKFSNLGFSAMAKYQASQWKEADALFKDVLTSYKIGVSVYVKGRWAPSIKPDVPIAFWEYAAMTKYQLGLWNDADSLFKEAFVVFEKSKELPSKVFSLYAIMTKYQLGEWQGSEDAQIPTVFWKRVLTPGEKEPAVIWEYAAMTKYQLYNWKEADSLFEKAIAAYKGHVPDRLKSILAEVKLNLETSNGIDSNLDRLSFPV